VRGRRGRPGCRSACPPHRGIRPCLDGPTRCMEWNAERRSPPSDAATVPDVAPSRSSAGHRDYSATPLARKLGIREGSRVLVVGAPSGFSLRAVPPGAPFASSARGPLDVVLLFPTTLADLRRRFPAAVRALDPAGRLWVAWPKKAAAVETDLTFEVVPRLGQGAGAGDTHS